MPHDPTDPAALRTDGPSIYPDTDYDEPLRNQFHYSNQAGWMNDVNGVWFADGKYHLTYQHFPTKTEWGPMHWGYATSPDLLHWTQHNPALVPGVNTKGMAYSGSAVIDTHNTLGLTNPDRPAAVLVYTDIDEGQSLATSTDGGTTWVRYPGNPVLGPDPVDKQIADRRDPKVLFHEPTGRWVMVIFRVGHGMEFFTSPDLRDWTHTSTFQSEHFWECPDLFELPVIVDGRPTGERRWVLQAALGTYRVGTFDGERFVPDRPDAPVQKMSHGPEFYAAQTVTNAPDGRTIQLGWLGMWEREPLEPATAWRHGVTFPVDLQLHRQPDGRDVVTRWPIPEIERLYAESHEWETQTVSGATDPLDDIDALTFDLTLDLDLEPVGDHPPPSRVELAIAGHRLAYDVGEQKLYGMALDPAVGLPVPPIDGRLKLRVLRDHAAIEVFGAEGLMSASREIALPSADGSVGLRVDGNARLVRLRLDEVNSAWPAAGASR